MCATPPELPSDDTTPRFEPLSIRGAMKRKELRKITRNMRSSILGPTAVYYAGVTAPAIAAGMATVAAAAFERAGWSDYWNFLISGIIASMAGISWYLIFMRLAYRHATGRSTETQEDTEFQADEVGLFWRRGAASTRVSWEGVTAIIPKRNFIHIRILDTGDFALPKSWFSSRKAMKAFADQLTDLKQAVMDAAQKDLKTPSQSEAAR